MSMSQLSKQHRFLKEYIALKAMKCPTHPNIQIDCAGCEGLTGLCHKVYKQVMIRDNKKRWHLRGSAPFPI
jgi:hypothetical protein